MWHGMSNWVKYVEYVAAKQRGDVVCDLFVAEAMHR